MHPRTSTSKSINGCNYISACKNVDVTEYLNPHVYLQEHEVNCVAAAALNVAVGRAVCGAAVEVDPEPRRTRQVMN